MSESYYVTSFMVDTKMITSIIVPDKDHNIIYDVYSVVNRTIRMQHPHVLPGNF